MPGYIGRTTGDRRRTGKILSFPRATLICCSSWRMIWCTRRSRFRLREAVAVAPPTPAARRCDWKPCLAAVLSDRRTSTRSTRRMTTGEPSCGLGECAGRRTSPRPAARFATSRGPAAENVTGIDRSIAGVRVALTEALVADPRNDDHAVMSQLTALFALLHNGLIDIIRRREDNNGPNGQFGAAYKRFLCAREALTAIYHNIIRNDLMRRVIHPAIYAAYYGPARTLSTAPHQRGLAVRDWEIPSSSRTAHSALATPWCGPNIRSMTCRSMTSTLR